MASFTKNMLVSDIILRISKGKPSDDLELEPKQVAFWIDQLMPALIKNSLDTKISNGLGIDPDYIKVEECVEPKIKLLDCKDCQDNVYVDLCHTPISLLRDRGVLRVATEDGISVDKIRIEDIEDLKRLKFARPSVKNVKYYRVKNRLYFIGITNDTIGLFKFTINYIPNQNLIEIADDTPIYVGDDILPLLAEGVEAIARRQVYQSNTDQENNAKQDLNIQ